MGEMRKYRMKRTAMILLMCLLTAGLAGCAASGADTGVPTVSPEPLTADLDLSAMSGTVVYSQVYSMMYEPEAYLGKIIKMSGYYGTYQDPARGVVYHACVIPDATACCAQGIEFIRAGEHAWPDDYPAEGTDITVTGRLSSYTENGMTYLHLVDAELVWKQEP